MISPDQKQAVKQIREFTIGLVVAVGLLVVFLIWRYQPIPKETNLQTAHSEEVEIDESGFAKIDFNLEEAIEIGRKEVATSSAEKNKAVAGGKNLSDKTVIYGFLPYWQLGKLDSESESAFADELTDISYFQIGLDKNGFLQRDEETDDLGGRQFSSSNWRTTVENWQKAGANRRLEVTVFSDQREVLEEILLNEVKMDRLVTDLHQLLSTDKSIQGINLDFEYFATASDSVQEGMTVLLTKIRKLIGEYHPTVRLTVDVFGRAGERVGGLYDWDKVTELVDYVILMGYDYKTRASSIPGPVAPTLGGSYWGGSDVFASLRALAKKVPSYQIILGVPFYGYSWQVTNFDLEEKTSRTYPETGKTMTFAQIQEILNWSDEKKEEMNLVEGWDEISLTPYIFYEEPVEPGQGSGGGNDKRVMVFYDDKRSLGYKLDLVNELELGGVAIWALGYEGQNNELWQVIREKIY